MKRFTLRVLIGLITFVVGVSIAAFVFLARNRLHGLDKRSLSQNQQQFDARVPAWQVLLSFQNQEWENLDEYSRDTIEKAIYLVLGKDESGPFGQPYVPSRFFKLSDSGGQASYLLIEKSRSFREPASYVIRVNVFNPGGKLLSSSVFDPGRRALPTEIRVTHLREIGREGIVISTRSTQWGTDQGKQYYALIRQELGLVRREDSRGELIRNGYSASPIGPEVAGRSAEEWQRALESDDAAEVLAALTWLAGIPLNHSRFDSGEETAEARLVDDVRSRERVKVTLKKLSQSENVWIREATELAAKAWSPTEREG